ncbi:MAG TPA: hypothetical protein VMW68_03185 [Methyloceanibacter sp.]|nr:hypothetical protein [Methyloceanibacter sp.]
MTVPPEAADLWALRHATSHTNSPDPSPAATAEDMWAQERPDEALPPPEGVAHSQERAAQAEALERLVRLNEEFL